MVFLSVSERIKPMKQVDFEMADQSLEEMFDWVSDINKQHWINGGHYNLTD